MFIYYIGQMSGACGGKPEQGTGHTSCMEDSLMGYSLELLVMLVQPLKLYSMQTSKLAFC